MRIEFAVTLQVQISLHVSDRENISDLGTDAEHPRPEACLDRMWAGIVGELLIRITDETDKELLGEKLRRAPLSCRSQKRDPKPDMVRRIF